MKRFLRKFREVKNGNDNENTHTLYIKVVLYIAGQLLIIIKKIINVYLLAYRFCKYVSALLGIGANVKLVMKLF